MKAAFERPQTVSATLRERHGPRASAVLAVAASYGVDSVQTHMAVLCALEEARIEGAHFIARGEERAVSLLVAPMEGDGLKPIPPVAGWQVADIQPHERPGLVDGGLLLITWRRAPTDESKTP